MERYTTFMDWKTQYSQDVNSFKIYLQIQYNPKQNFTELFADSMNLICRSKGTVLKEKSKVGASILTDFKTYYKATVIRTV